MNAKVKALAWEECRVAGAIAAVCLLAGLFTLISFRISYGWLNWGNYDPDFLNLILLSVPMLTALLLILNPNYSGHLAGGFPARVLRLPVNASAAVASALIARTLFVFVVSLVMTTAAQAIFGFVPELRIAALIVFFYVFAQAMDWLRGPISGLSSILLVLCVAGLSYVLASGGHVFEAALATSTMPPLRWGLALIAVMTAAYFISVSAVHATRVGRSTGIPEIWEWPRRIALGRRGRTRAFSSPMAAQIWFEVRRAGWTLPAATLSLWIIASGVLWLYIRPDQNTNEEYRLLNFRNYSSIFIFVSFFLATFIHGMRTRVVGFRRNTEVAGHEWMQPLTSAEFALARIISNALLFLPTLLLVTAVHFALIGGTFLTSFVPEALEIGTASIREVVWVVISRGVLLGIVAWMFVAAGTRLLRASVALALLIFVAFTMIAFLQTVNVIAGLAGQSTRWAAITAFLLYHVVLTGVVYARLWKEGYIPIRTLAAWGAGWALTSCFIYYATLSNPGGSPASTPPLWNSLITSFAHGSLVVLPYAAILLDVRRRRHGATRDQDPTQHHRARRGLSPKSKVGIRILAAATVLFMLWLAWPAEPAYKALWRSNGYPVTLAELDAWYKQVPEDENIALKYSAVSHDMIRASTAYFFSAPNRAASEKLLFVGIARLPRTGPIPKDQWETNEAYWEHVTSPIASRLKEIEEGPSRSGRYPIDLREGHWVSLPHLSGVRALARELSLDALYWTLADNTAEAAASLRAIFPIAESLSEEPHMISQLIRHGIYSSAAGAIETTMNRGLLLDTDLARISEAIDLALPTPDEPLMLRRGIIGESVLNLALIGTPQAQGLFPSSPAAEGYAFLGTFNEIMNPPTANRIVLATHYERNIRASSEGLQFFKPRAEKWALEMHKVGFVAPWAMLASYVGSHAQGERKVRMLLEVTRTGLAVERFRLAHGSLPENLEELVPVFLPLIPEDAYAKPGQPIRYRYTDEGEFVVYSLGPDKEDDLGEEAKRSYGGDITFTLAPLHIRTQEQIAP